MPKKILCAAQLAIGFLSDGELHFKSPRGECLRLWSMRRTRNYRRWPDRLNDRWYDRGRWTNQDRHRVRRQLAHGCRHVRLRGQARNYMFNIPFAPVGCLEKQRAMIRLGHVWRQQADRAE